MQLNENTGEGEIVVCCLTLPSAKHFSKIEGKPVFILRFVIGYQSNFSFQEIYDPFNYSFKISKQTH